MFVLTCPHCQAEVKTRVARPGATVMCMACQQTYTLDAAHIREAVNAGTPVPAAPAFVASPEQGLTEPDPKEASNPADSRVTLAAINEMAQALPRPEPKVDIYAGQSAFSAATVQKWTQLVLATTLLVAVVVGAIWFFMFYLPTPKNPPPRLPTKTHEPGTTPASEY